MNLHYLRHLPIADAAVEPLVRPSIIFGRGFTGKAEMAMEMEFATLLSEPTEVATEPRNKS